MTDISDYKVYNYGMQKSMIDKLFYIDKIFDIKNILDFGCANGEMLKHLGNDYNLYGYDIDETMLDIAKINCPNATYSDRFEELIDYIIPEETLLTLSSVIHEVYSYSSKEEVDLFWDRVYNTGFKYISIRDLMVSKSCDRKIEINDYVKMIQNSDQEQLKEFTEIWGDLNSNKQMIHYLLKYRYKANWEREVRENYLPITTEELLKSIPVDKYEIIYFEHYILPFNKETINNKYNINIVDNTHVKLLLKRIK